MKLALIVDLGIGWRTTYLNWTRHFPQDMEVEPTWIVLSDEKTFWIDRIPKLPRGVKTRLRNSLMIREGLRQGPFDATYISTSAALTALPHYMKRHPSFLAIDATPKQIYAFGDLYGWRPSRFPVLERMKHEQRAAAFQQTYGIFSQSRWAGDSAVADYGASPERIHILPPGVDLTQWTPGDFAQKSGKDSCDILFVGGDFARKGGPLLLQWAASTKLTGWRLHVVTPKSLETSDSRIHVYNNLTSNDPQLVQLFRNADVFAIPTKADCTAFAAIEALASGLPVVITDTGATSEIVQHGKTGFLIQPNDLASLSEGLEPLIQDSRLRRRMGEAARADAECRYDAPQLIRRAVQIMKDSI